jgi:hypothetical protein
MKTLILGAIRCSLMFIAAAAVSLAHPASANLITNPGFETGDFTGWSTPFCPFCHVDSTNPHSGQYAAVLREGTINQPVNLASGQGYILSFWLASTETTGALLIVINGDFFTEISPGTFDYTLFNYASVQGMGPTTLEFHFLGPSTGTWYLDDVSLTPGVPEPFSTLWLALPFAGMVAFRRFRIKSV